MYDEYMVPYEAQRRKRVIGYKPNAKNMSFSTPKLNTINFSDSFSSSSSNRMSHNPMINSGQPFSYIYPNQGRNLKKSGRTMFDPTLKSRSRSYSDFSYLLPSGRGKVFVSNNFEPEANSSLGPAATTVIVHVHQAQQEREMWSKNQVYEHLNSYHGSPPQASATLPRKKLTHSDTFPEHGPSKMNNLQESEQQLPTFQVSQQRKYRNRHQSEDRIKQIDHLRKSSSCADLIDHLHTGMGPKKYGNVSPLKAIRLPDTNSVAHLNNSKEDIQSSREHIYEEIDEPQPRLKNINDTKNRQPMLKKVTFLLPRDYMTKEEEVRYKKKIIPVIFWGISEVLVQLREKSEEYRCTIAHMSCRAVQLNYSSHSLQFLGKVDTSRKGEQMFVVIGQENFEIRDSDGLLVTKHRPTDVSVIVSDEKDPNLVTYIGKCKFMGRIAIVFRFNKSKHLTLLRNFFRANTLNQSEI